MHTVLFAVSDTRGLVIPGTLKVNGISVGKVKDFGTYHALLIYVEKYDNLQNLKTPKKDVEAIADILKNRYGFKEITIVRNPKNRDALIEILDDLQRKLNEDDNLLIYYAGHGNKEGFWQLSSARKNSRVGWIPLAQAVNYTLNKIRSRHILVVADSCYAGMLTREGTSMSSLSPEDKKYYTKLNQIKSRNVLTGGGFQPVLDEDSVNPNHSVFANGFLDMLKNNNKPLFAMDEQYAKVKRYVQLNTQDQMPLYGDVRRTGHQDGGDFIFIDQSVLKEQAKVKETTQTTLTPKTSSEQPLVNDVQIEKEKEEPRPPSLYALSIKTTPTDAKIFMMNIRPKYQDRMRLKKGKYTIKIMAEGYKKKILNVILKKDSAYDVVLEKVKHSSLAKYDITGIRVKEQTKLKIGICLNTKIRINIAKEWLKSFFLYGGGMDCFKKNTTYTKKGYDFYNLTALEILSGLKIDQRDGNRLTSNDTYSQGEQLYISPKFAKWLYNNFTTEKSNSPLYNLFSKVYEKNKYLARSFFLSYKYLLKYKIYDKEVMKYKQAAANRREMLDYLGKTFDPVLFKEYEKNIYDYSNGYYDDGYNRFRFNIGFWLRRGIDGTSVIFKDSLIQILKMYDGSWYDNHK